jgi:hypothetical protein
MGLAVPWAELGWAWLVRAMVWAGVGHVLRWALLVSAFCWAVLALAGLSSVMRWTMMRHVLSYAGKG